MFYLLINFYLFFITCFFVHRKLGGKEKNKGKAFCYPHLKDHQY